MTAAPPVAKIKALADRTPLIRASDAVKAGVSRTALIRMTRSGEVERVGRGLYRLKTGESYSHPDLVEAAIRVPKSVIVLLSALNFQGLGTQTAWKVWLQLPANFPAPRVNHPPLQVIRSRKPEAFTLGVETHQIAGHPIRITDPDRTIVDCFKHRNTVTLEVCLEALKERLHQHRQSIETLQQYARKFGVSRVMQPYLEALA
jgi:predicted transcriptional regulator of viral defense system